MRRSIAVLTLVAGLGPLLAAASPAPREARPIPTDDGTAVVKRYVGDLAAGKYDDAFGLLAAADRKYHHDAAAFASVFAADHYTVRGWKIVDVHTVPAGRVYLVQQTVRFRDLGAQLDKRMTAVVPVGAVREGGHWVIRDPGKPQAAYASSATQTAGGVRATVRKVSLFPDRVELVVNFSNVGDGFVTLLPYNKTTLKDDAGDAYPIVALKDWTLTDRRLFEGLRLAAGRDYTGVLSFTRPHDTGIPPKRFDLDVAPVVRDGGDAPFDLNLTVPATAG